MKLVKYHENMIKDKKGAWEAYKASVPGIRQYQQVCQSVFPEGEAEICWPVDAATLKASSVSAIAVVSAALRWAFGFKHEACSIKEGS